MHRADFQDRYCGVMVMATLFGTFPFLKKLYADAAYQGPEFNRHLAGVLPCVKAEIVKRSDRANGFVVLPKRWVVEHTLLDSADTARSPGTERPSTQRRSPFCPSPVTASCSKGSVISHAVPGQTLRLVYLWALFCDA
jgi:hypothetical protein